jgi:hypothetical protein
MMIAIASPLRAADDEALALARRVLEANGMAEKFNKRTTEMISPLVAKIKDPQQAASARVALQESLGKIHSEMIVDISKYIAEQMSKDEMTHAITFFESPTGRKLGTVLDSDQIVKITAPHVSKIMVLIAMAGGGLK